MQDHLFPVDIRCRKEVKLEINSAVMVAKRVPGYCCQVTKGIDTIRSGQWFRQTEHIMSSQKIGARMQAKHIFLIS